mmetsp:Transcript_86718/g.166910  ORF Transcript_86718/g.166910 Transcript_86718/m.166910 type:complete len:102 (+) Transcript_86718:274-579(+)
MPSLEPCRLLDARLDERRAFAGHVFDDTVAFFENSMGTNRAFSTRDIVHSAKEGVRCVFPATSCDSLADMGIVVLDPSLECAPSLETFARKLKRDGVRRAL